MPDHPSKRCLKILDLLPRFIENDFSEAEEQEIRAHLAACPSCQAEYEAMLGLLDTLDTLPNLTVPSSFKEAVMRHLPPGKKTEKS